MDIENDLQAVRRVFIHYPKRLKSARDELNKIDEETRDLMHVFELGKLNAINKSELSKQLTEVRIKRREIKNEIEQIESVQSLFRYNVDENEINSVIGESRNIVENQGRRSYCLRVRKDLERFLEGAE